MSTGNQFYIKRNDTLPSLKIQLIDKSCLGSRIPYDLTSLTGATFTMKNDCGDSFQSVCVGIQTGGTTSCRVQDVEYKRSCP